MKEGAIIAIIAVVVVLLLTGCNHTTGNPGPVVDNSYELQFTPAGPMRFQPSTGSVDIMVSTPGGMRWIEVPNKKVELVPVPIGPGMID